ncbi:hypothetical protein D6833_11635 [Candidatus Parcubacteria bacterium]|nr:MAG: hypothetical protein D6833_11635 [Candidatus Parcubacteria bacterium]
MGSWAGDMVERTTKAMQTGYLRGANRGLQESLAAWKAHARELENNVEYFRALAGAYRGDAFTGWARAGAYKRIAQELGANFDDPVMREKVDRLTEEERADENMKAAIDKDAKAIASGQKQ